MRLAIVGCILAWLTVLAGVSLAVIHGRRAHPPGWLLWAHPAAATATLVCVWVAVALLPGPANLLFNSGAFVTTLAFVAGAFMFSLRVSVADFRPHVLMIGLHGAVALAGCALLTTGLLHALAAMG